MLLSEKQKQQHDEFVKFGNEILKQKGFKFDISYSLFEFITDTSEEFIVSPCHVVRCEKTHFSLICVLCSYDEQGDESIVFKEQVGL